MMFYKARTLLFVSFLMSLSACWKPEGGAPHGDAAASFNVTTFKGEAQTPNDLQTKWRVPLYKIMNYTACIEERTTTNKAKGQKFVVIDPVTGQTVADDLRTTNTSCMTWQERLPYNYFAKRAYYIEMKRIIRATGSHVGEREVVFYVNPWAKDREEKDAESVVFKREEKVDQKKVAPQSMSAKALSGDLHEKPRLWLTDLNLKITKGRQYIDDKNQVAGAALTFDMNFKPVVELYTSSGEIYWKKIRQGNFKVFSHLLVNDIGTNKNQKTILTKDSAPAIGRMVYDSVLVEQKNVLMSGRATNGILELAMRVEAMEGPSSVEGFEGVFRMDHAQNLIGHSSPTIKLEVIDENKKFSLKDYLASATNIEELKKTHHVLNPDPYTFTIARPRYLKVGAGETATKRAVEYMVNTCVIDNQLGSNIGEGAKFVVELSTGERKQVEADNQGCIRWNSKLSHQYYQPEKFFFEDVKIFDETGKVQIGKKSFAINPWDDKFTFGWDRLEMEDKFFDEIQKRELIPSKFYLDQFSYHTLRFRYEIDKFMNLQVKKTILLELHPQILRYSGIVGGRKVTEPVRDGIYLMKVAIQKDYLDPAERNVFIRNRKNRERSTQPKEISKKYYVDVASKLVQVFDGRIITPVELSMSDLRLMRVRSQFLIQLEAVDEEKVQVSNLVNEKYWSHLKRNRNQSNLPDTVTDDDKKDALREKLAKDKAERQKELNKVLVWLNTKTINNPEFAEQNGLNQQDMELLHKKLAVNDFSQFDLSPYVNPDLYIDKDSGVEKRTFTGPIIFLSNAYSDSVRPTDALNEVYCETNDCNYIEEMRRNQGYAKPSENYEHNRYFGSIAHLADKHVDEFISKKLEMDKEYFSKMPQVASLGNFADVFNINIVSMSDETFLSLKENCDLESLNQCQVPSPRQIKVSQLPLVLNSRLEQFIGDRDLNLKREAGTATPAFLNPENRKEQGHNFTKAEFDKIWRAPVLEKQYAEWVCYMIAGRTVADEKLSYKLMRVYKDCLMEYANNPETFMVIDRKLRVGETGSYEFRGGKQMNMNVSSSFSIGHSNSSSVSTGVEAFDIISAIPVIGDLLKKVIKPLSLKVGSSESASISDGTSVSEQTYLVMQMANFMVDINSYERCFALRPATQWLQKTQIELQSEKRRGRGEEGYSEDLKSQGVMICSGEQVQKPVNVMESYFYFTQHFTEGDMLDQYDLYNHPWLLALRGVRDFTHFAKLLRKQSDKSIDWFNPLSFITDVTGLTNSMKPWDKSVDKTGWPLDKMAETYGNMMPSFPGLYTLVNQDEFIQDYPWAIQHTDLSYFESKGYDQPIQK